MSVRAYAARVSKSVVLSSHCESHEDFRDDGEEMMYCLYSGVMPSLGSC
jgi:hypothetical protein